jgi:hypothetical protein
MHTNTSDTDVTEGPALAIRAPSCRLHAGELNKNNKKTDDAHNPEWNGGVLRGVLRVASVGFPPGPSANVCSAPWLGVCDGSRSVPTSAGGVGIYARSVVC